MGYVMDKDNNFVLLCDNCVVFIFIVEDYFGSILEIMEFDLKELIRESWLDILIVVCDKCQKVKYCSEDCWCQVWVC